MTKPRVVRSEIEPVYSGRFSRTRLEEHQVASPDGSTFVASLYRVIDGESDEELLQKLADGSLNRVVCPNTGQLITLDLPIIVHAPKAKLLFLVISQERRHEEIRLRMELLKELASESEPLPSYVLNFRAVFPPFGPEELAAACEEQRLIADLKKERRRLQRESRPLKTAIPPAAKPKLATAKRRPALRERPQKAAAEPPEDSHDTKVQRSPFLPIEVEEEEEEFEILTTGEIELIDEGDEAEQEEEEEDEEEGGKEASVVHLHLASEALPTEPTGNEPTLKSRLPKVAPVEAKRAVDGDSVTEPILLVEDVTPDTDVALGEGLVIRVGQRVAVHFAVEEERLDAFLDREPDAFLQLHRMPWYPLITILLSARDEKDRLVDELFCALDVRDQEHREVLSALESEFCIDVHLYDAQGRRVEYLQFRKPLEQNVTRVVGRAEEWVDQVDEKLRSFSKAVEFFGSEGYERIGAQRHNFHRDSFAHIPSVGAARLAVSMVGYWSEAQNFDYLIENRSFPLETFERVRARVIEAALRFGIFLPPELRAAAVGLGLARNEEELLDQLVERFAELTTVPQATDEIDSMAQSENWDQLLTACVDLGVAVDDRIKEHADAVRRRARRAGATHPRAQVPELDVTHEYQRVSSMDQASNEALRELLQKGGMAPEASKELLGRGGETNILHVIEAARVLDEDAIESTARFLAAGAEQFEPALLIGLGRVHPRIVHLCALSLAMARRTEALPTLIELLHDEKRSAKLPIRDIVAQYGSGALPELFSAIEKRGPTEALVEVMALISIDSGRDVVDALRKRPKPVLLEAAQKMTAVRKRLGGRRIRTLQRMMKRAAAKRNGDDVDDEG